jgi:hypothetical protein
LTWFTRWLGRQPRTSVSSRRSIARLQVEALEERQVPTVQYFGGNLLPHVNAQALYYGSAWTGTTTPSTATLDSFLGTLTGGAYMQALTNAGYGVGLGTATKGVVDSTAVTATNTVISDTAIQAHIQADIKSGLVQSPDSFTNPSTNQTQQPLYVVYVEPNVAVNLGGGQGTTQQGILGYHSDFFGTDAAGKAVTVRYAVIAYPGGTVGNSSLGIGNGAIDQLTSVTSHEVAEAVTDPDVGTAVNWNQIGWYDQQRGEIGDVTENNPNAYVRLGPYLVQEVGDQNDQLLAINAPSTPTTPTTPTTPSNSTTTTLSGVAGRRRHGYPTVNFTVTITPASGSLGPGDTVELLDGNTVLGTATVRVVNGKAVATFSVYFTQPGSYTFTAMYMGSSQFQASSSNTVTVTVR